MKTRSAVALYARISQDRDGTGLGVARQLADCRADAERRGWKVAEAYVDDDFSAYSAKTRPAYQRMLADIANGARDAVIVWHLDRLHRRPIELEEFVTTCTRAGLTDVVTLHGDLDLAKGDGLLVARLLSAVAANESDAKSRRGRRKMQELAEAGKPHGGGTRPFGFQADRTTHQPDEADAIRQLAARALAGESLISLARWLADSDIRTVQGHGWRTTTVRGLLLNPRNYGIRVHQGTPLGTAGWAPIISPEDGERLRQLLTDPARRTNRTARRYLLSGLCRCGRCGTVMFSAPRYDARRYLCRSGHDFGGCGRMAITAAPLESLITEALLFRLDSPEMARAVTGTAADAGATAALHAQVQADSDQLEELAGMYADKDITAQEWRAARHRIEQRRTEARRTLSRLQGTSVLDPYVGGGDELRTRWAELNLSRQVAIVKAVVDHIVIHPATLVGRRGLDPDRVQAIWRL
jgi:site-specific DNA recombinase